ncbi:hypothetical protein SCHPADRAFT_890298 [Schizopora paradoxa]|uniref:DUF6534 domain-containing protein n=1 Tax=Schizopora paradoxa TaxID=27342 RepID=A0A0H2RML5_9AGAM|nr:hypothetical protein SCHPADRAFT_890298 [Schizopora paradoxa]
MSTNIFTPGYILKHPNDFIGPQIASVIIQGVQLGVIGNQVMRYLSTWRSGGKKEPAFVKWTVIVTLVIMMRRLTVLLEIILLDRFQTCLNFRRIYIMTVYEFGNWMGLTAAPVQAFFIRRCWVVFGKKPYILFPLIAFLIGNIVTLILTIHYLFTFNRVAFIINPPKHLPYFCKSYNEIFVRIVGLTSEPVVLFYAFAACLDVCVTSIMMFYLTRARSQALSRTTNAMIRRLMFSIWEAALPPAVCATVAMVVYLTRNSHDYWIVFLQGILGKLYVISLFAVLNARSKIKANTFETGIITKDVPGTITTTDVSSGDTNKVDKKKNSILSSIRFARTRSTAPDVKITMMTEIDSEKEMSTDDSTRDSSTKGADAV